MRRAFLLVLPFAMPLLASPLIEGDRPDASRPPLRASRAVVGPGPSAASGLSGEVRPGVAAAQAEVPRELTLQAYVEEVLRTNLEAAAQRQNLPMAEAQVALSRLLPDPELSGGISSKELYGPAKPTSPTQFNLGLAWTLELGGKRSARVEVAKSEQRRTQAEFSAYLGELRATAVGAYTDALRARLVLERKRKTLEGFRELLKLNELRHGAGDIGGLELTQSRVEARRFEGEVLAAEAELRGAEALLASLLGGPWTAVRATGSLDLKPLSVEREALLALALAHRPALVKARHTLEVAEAGLRLAKANRWVDLGLSVGLNHTPAVIPTGVDGEGNPFPSPALRSKSLSLGVSVPLPFSRRPKGELILAEGARTQSRLQIQSEEQQTRAELEGVLAQFEAVSRQLAAYRSGIPQDPDKVLEGILCSYQRGNASAREWNNAQRTQSEVYLAYLETLASHVKARVALDRVTGQSTTLDLQVP